MVLSSSPIVGGEDIKPQLNFIFFIVDDLGWADLSSSGSTFHETPNIDGLAKDGLTLSRAYAAAPRCTPSRTSILTGKLHARPGVLDDDGLNAEQITMAEAFKQNGYRTFFAGKWHIGKTPEAYPEAHGFDVNKGGCFWGQPGGPLTKYGNEAGGGFYFSPYGCPTLEEGPEGEYITDRLTDETVAFIEDHQRKHPGKPFLAYLSHYGVHTPYEGKKEDVEYFSNKLENMKTADGPDFITDGTGKVKMKQDHVVYAAMVKAVDDSMGKLRKELKRMGLEENTAIIFTSDNGGLSTTVANGNRNLATSNYPLRTGKGWLYEGGIREPTIVYWPGVTPQGKRTDRPVVNMDFYPTMLDMAGCSLLSDQHLDGSSFKEVLQGDFDLPREPIFFYYAMAKVGTGNPSMAVMMDMDWKLVQNLYADTFELYNLRQDIGEQNDLLTKFPERANKMKNALQNWQKNAKMPPLSKANIEENQALYQKAGLK